MRERITFIQKLGDSLEPSAVRVDGGTISAPEVQAVREDRLTFGLDELPSELRTLIKDSHEFHIRWVSERPYETVSPLLARLPPGFHVFFTPRKNNAVSYVTAKPGVASMTLTDESSETLCPTLAKIFGDVSCSTPAVSHHLSISSSRNHFQTNRSRGIIHIPTQGPLLSRTCSTVLPAARQLIPFHPICQASAMSNNRCILLSQARQPVQSLLTRHLIRHGFTALACHGPMAIPAPAGPRNLQLETSN